MATLGGYTNSVPSEVNNSLFYAASTAIAPGDLTYADAATGSVMPASSIADAGDAASTQRLFASRFAGVSAGRQSVSDTTGRKASFTPDREIINYACDSDTYEVGDYVAPKYTGGVLSNQTLVKVTDPTRAIGKVTNRYTSVTTTVQVRLTSRLFSGLVLDAGGQATVAAPPAASTSAPGTALSYTGGAGFKGVAGTGSAGGAAAWTGGAGGTATSGTAGAGAAAPITGGAGGTATTGTGGAGASAGVYGGVGGLTSAGTGAGGAGGSAYVRPALGGASFGGTAGVPGLAILGRSTGTAAWAFGCVRSTISDAGTLTAAQHRGMVLYQNAGSGSVTMTTLTGTLLAAAFPDMAIGDALPQFVASNHASNTSTLSGGVDVALVGSGAVTQLGGMFLLIKTAATTFDLVRVG